MARAEPPRRVARRQGADAFANSCLQSIVDERKPWTYEFMTHTDVSEDCVFFGRQRPAGTR
jgi:hypothetical protein